MASGAFEALADLVVSSNDYLTVNAGKLDANNHLHYSYSYSYQRGEAVHVGEAAQAALTNLQHAAFAATLDKLKARPVNTDAT